MDYIVLLLTYIMPLFKSLLNNTGETTHCQKNFVSKNPNPLTCIEYQMQSRFKILIEAKEINTIPQHYASFIHSHGPPLIRFFKIT